jgi:Cu(I)/Ag(I) efflux system membrane protein CusA/SilA
MIETIVLLKPREQWRPGMTKEKIIAELDAKLRIPGVRNGWTQPIINRINMLSTGVRTELGVKIFGDDLDSLEAYAIRAEKILSTVPGAVDVAAERVQGGSFLDITVDEAAAARYGIAVGDVQRLIETAIGGVDISQVVAGRARYPIQVRYSRELRDNLEALGNILVPIRAAGSASGGMITSGAAAMPAPAAGMQESGAMGGATSMSGPSPEAFPAAPSGSGGDISRSMTSSISALGDAPARGYVRFSDVAKITLAPGPSMIASENGQLRSIVYLNLRNRDQGSFIREAESRLNAELKLPAGYTYEWSGQYQEKARAERTLAIVIPLVFLVIFVLLYLTMKDWKEAAVIMLSVPFALIGGMYYISILGYNFSVAVWVGFIALYGIAVQTGVVMVVYLHHALDRRLRLDHPITGADIEAATMEGAVQRLRPKLMTVATAMLGLVPIMYSTGVGSDVMKPLVAPLIGGLLTSAIHVLLMTPVLFVMMKERAMRRGTLRQSQMAGWM